jgi:ferrous iron transport protein A
MPVTLERMKKGSKGKVTEVVGGKGVMQKLSAQGILPGKVVEKVGHLRGGPVLVRVGRCQMAVGLGLARKVHVEVTDA